MRAQAAVYDRAVIAAAARVALETAPPRGPAFHRSRVLCPYRLLFGRSCPVCGTTRSVMALAHGDWRGARAEHPLGPLTAVCAAYVLGRPRDAAKVLVPWTTLLVAVWLFRLHRGDIR